MKGITNDPILPNAVFTENPIDLIKVGYDSTVNVSRIAKLLFIKNRVKNSRKSFTIKILQV